MKTIFPSYFTLMGYLYSKAAKPQCGLFFVIVNELPYKMRKKPERT